MQKFLNLLACPRCKKASLVEGDDQLICTNCNAVFEISHGCPVFLKEKSHSSGFLGVMQRGFDTLEFLELTKKIGWRAAIKRTQVEGEPDKLNEINNEFRTSFLDLLDLNPHSTIVDIGSGTGGVVLQAAQKGLHVISIDRSEVDASFVREMVKQERLDRVTCVLADGINLPIQSNSVDAVAVVGVLEWAAADYPNENPREIQLEFLQEARRVLKKKGKLYLAIENANFIGYYLGRPEPHCRLPFISLLDDSSADKFSMATRGHKYLEKTYTLDGYLEILLNAGFEKVESYWPSPNYRTPNAFVSLEIGDGVKWFANNLVNEPTDSDFDQMTLSFLRFSPSGLGRYFTRDYAFVCEKP